MYWKNASIKAFAIGILRMIKRERKRMESNTIFDSVFKTMVHKAPAY